jgi:DNA-binding LytR/AlgR family response regulator
MNPPTALIAEDEPLLAAALQAELARAWPQLQVVATVADGRSAVDKALALQPDVLFFDIQMPGQSGLEAALELADAWPLAPTPGRPACKPFPALVFVTAFDQYAVAAFETQAVDYLLKPVQTARLQKTIQKVQKALSERTQNALSFDATLAQLRELASGRRNLAPAPATAPLTLLQISVGNAIRMVPVGEVACFEAADKYVRVLTAATPTQPGHDYLIRRPLKDLLPQLDSQTFWQVHRGTVVQASLVELVTRDDSGKLWLQLRGLSGKLAVSRLYAHLFKAL